ncbi:MAG TPA: hypothetical protein VI248_02385 [Kineosporiaceae bacterium]
MHPFDSGPAQPGDHRPDTGPADPGPVPVQRVSLRGAPALVQAVPYLLGYADLGDDLVLIATREHLTVLTVAVDLDALPDAHLWTAITPALERAGAAVVHLVAYPATPVNDARLAGLHAAFVAAATGPRTGSPSHGLSLPRAAGAGITTCRPLHRRGPVCPSRRTAR